MTYGGVPDRGPGHRRSAAQEARRSGPSWISTAPESPKVSFYRCPHGRWPPRRPRCGPRQVAGGDDEDRGPGQAVQFLRVVRAGRAEFDGVLPALQLQALQFAQHGTRACRPGRSVYGGELRHRRLGDVQQLGGDRLTVGHTGAAHDVHRLLAVGPEGVRDGRGRHRGGAVDGLPVVSGSTGPRVLLAADGHAHARRRDGRTDTAAALQPAFQLQLLQGLTERGTGDTETGGEIALVRQDLAHGEFGVQCFTEHRLEMPVLRFRHRFQLRGPHPVLRNRRGPAAF